MWSYSGFNEFRERLREQAQYSWKDMQENINGDILHVFLWYSDCDGSIESSKCDSLADRLVGLVDSWDHDDEDRYQAMLLIQGLRSAAANGDDLQFR